MKETLTDYKKLAVLFHYPNAELVQLLKELSAFRDAAETISLEDLQREYMRLFTATVAGGLPPYEMEYGKIDIFLKAQLMADIAGFYRAFGLGLTESSHERVDFIAAELEFMHWLLLKEMRARARGDGANEVLCREGGVKFLHDHLGRWGSYFGGQIHQSARHPFYRWLGETLQQTIDSECRRLGVKPERVEGLNPEPDAGTDFECSPDADETSPQPLRVIDPPTA